MVQFFLAVVVMVLAPVALFGYVVLKILERIDKGG